MAQLIEHLTKSTCDHFDIRYVSDLNDYAQYTQKISIESH
jgi:hypothetical protein